MLNVILKKNKSIMKRDIEGVHYIVSQNISMCLQVIGTVTAIPMKNWNTKYDTWLNFRHIDNLIITGSGQFEGQGGSGWWNCKKVTDY